MRSPRMLRRWNLSLANNSGWLVFAFDLSLRLWFCARIVRRRLPAGVAWAWLSIILFLPLIGTTVYLYFGEYRQSGRRQRRLQKSKEIIDRIAREPIALAADNSILTDTTAALSRAFCGMMGLPVQAGNDVELLANSAHGFDRLIADVNAAEKTIDLEFFIWSEGGRADAFADELLAAAQRGVKCRLLVDAVGSMHFIRGKRIRQMRAGGVNVVAALPSGFWRSLTARPDLRVHRKIVVIDGAIGYTGSMNLADPEFFKRDAGVGKWVDALARIQGPAVSGLYAVFLSDWCAETGADFAAARAHSQILDRAQAKRAAIQCLPSGPAFKDSAIEQALLMSIGSARSELILTTPYFIPSEALFYSLVGAARRGVRTTLIVPQQVDSRLTQHASRSFLQELVEAGVVVALYRPGLLHTKSVTVDREFSLFGSLNLDPRSLRINFEITLAVYDPGFTRDLMALQNSYLQDSLLYTLDQAAKQTAVEVWKGDLARLVGPLL